MLLWYRLCRIVMCTRTAHPSPGSHPPADISPSRSTSSDAVECQQNKDVITPTCSKIFTALRALFKSLLIRGSENFFLLINVYRFRFIPYFFSSYSCWWWKVFLLSLVCICLRSNENHPDPPTLPDQPSSATKPWWQCPSLRHGYETRNHGNGDKRLMAFLVLKEESTSFLWKQRKTKEQGLNLLHLTPDALLFSKKEQNKKWLICELIV